MSNELSRYKKPIFIKDRDYEVANELISKITNNQNDIDNLMRLYRSKSGFFDAEGFMIYLDYIGRKENKRFINIPNHDEFVKIIKERTNVDSLEEADNILNGAIKTVKSNGDLRKYYIESSKDYKECKTNKEKEEYIKVHF